MTLMPIASFLAGSLLSLLLPTLLLIALVVWYVKFARRVPDTDEADVPPSPAAREPAPAMGNPEPGQPRPGSPSGER